MCKGLKCQVCGFDSVDLEEVCYYDINGYSHSSEQDIENNAQNPDALAFSLCTECAGIIEEMDGSFEKNAHKLIETGERLEKN